MTKGEAEELRDFVYGLGGHMRGEVRRSSRGGWKLVVISGYPSEPPRSFTKYASAFHTYCAEDFPDGFDGKGAP